jgi:hypothetical protein
MSASKVISRLLLGVDVYLLVCFRLPVILDNKRDIEMKIAINV